MFKILMLSKHRNVHANNLILIIFFIFNYIFFEKAIHKAVKIQ